MHYFLKITWLAACIILTSGLSAGEPIKIIQAEFIPPYIYENESGNIVGLFYELTTEALKRAETDSKIIIVPWARGYANVAQGKTNALVPTFRTRERELDFIYPDEPLGKINTVLLKKNGTNINWSGNLNVLSNQRVAIVRDVYISHDFNQEIEDKKLTVYRASSYETLLKMLVADRVDIIAMPEMTAAYIIKKNDYKNIEALKPSLNEALAYIAFTKADRELTQKVSKAIKKMSEDGFTQERINHYSEYNNVFTQNRKTRD